MRISINNDNLYSLSFADNYLIFAEDEDDAYCMLKKLNGEYVKWGLQIHFDKSEYTVVGGTERVLEIEHGSVVKYYTTYKYLETDMSSKEGSE